MASSPLAWDGHQPPVSEQLTREQRHLCLLHIPSARTIQPTDVGLLILSSDRSTLDHIQPQFLSHASTCCGVSSPRVVGLKLQRAWFGVAGMMTWVFWELGGMRCM